MKRHDFFRMSFEGWEWIKQGNVMYYGDKKTVEARGKAKTFQERIKDLESEVALQNKMIENLEQQNKALRNKIQKMVQIGLN